MWRWISRAIWGADESEEEKYNEINCYGAIDEGDFQKLLRESTGVPECDRELVRHASAYLSKQAGSVWKNARFYLYGHTLCVVLTSGNKANHFAAAFDPDGQVFSYCKERGWKMLIKYTIREGAILVWNTFKDKIGRVLGEVIQRKIKDVLRGRGIQF